MFVANSMRIKIVLVAKRTSKLIYYAFFIVRQKKIKEKWKLISSYLSKIITPIIFASLVGVMLITGKWKKDLVIMFFC